MRNFKLYSATINSNSMRSTSQKPIQAANKIAGKLFANTQMNHIDFAIQDISSKKIYKYSAKHVYADAHKKGVKGGMPVPSLQKLSFEVVSKNTKKYNYTEASKQTYTHFESSLEAYVPTIRSVLDSIIYNDNVLDFYKETSYLEPYKIGHLTNTFENIANICNSIISYTEHIDQNKFKTLLKLNPNEKIEIVYNKEVVESKDFTTYLHVIIKSSVQEYISFSVNVSHIKQGLYSVYLQYSYNLHKLLNFNDWLYQIFTYKLIYNRQNYSNNTFDYVIKEFNKLSPKRVLENIYINYYYYLPKIKTINKTYPGNIVIRMYDNDSTNMKTISIGMDEKYHTFYNIYVHYKSDKIKDITFYNDEKNQEAYERMQEEIRRREKEESEKKRQEWLESLMQHDPYGPPPPYY